MDDPRVPANLSLAVDLPVSWPITDFREMPQSRSYPEALNREIAPLRRCCVDDFYQTNSRVNYDFVLAVARLTNSAAFDSRY